MYRYRRLVLIDRLIPFLAAGVGFVALLAVMAAQVQMAGRSAAFDAEVATARDAVAAATAGLAAPEAQPAEEQAAESTAVAALDERVARLEADLADARAQIETARTAAPAAKVPALPADIAVATDSTDAFEDAVPPATDAASMAPASIDPSLPTTDCIPLGTRFMATPNDSYPICQSKTVIKVGNITSDMVDVAGAGPIPSTGFANLPGTTCTVMVFSADAEGFAELRVTCN